MPARDVDSEAAGSHWQPELSCVNGGPAAAAAYWQLAQANTHRDMTPGPIQPGS